MTTPSNLSGQLTKVLATNTRRKSGLKELWMMTVEITKMLDAPKEVKDSTFLYMIEIAKKLAKVADAVDKYIRQERIEIKKLQRDISKHGNPSLILADDSSKLDAIVEEVLSQGKSTLDVLAKVLDPLVGVKCHTYGEAGKKVSDALKNNTPGELKERAKPLVEMIDNEDDWIKAFKNYRDTQHYRNLGITPLRVDSKGNVERQRMPKGEPVAEFLDILHINLHTFVVDFLAGALYIRLHRGLGLVAMGKGIKKYFRLAMENPPKTI